MRGRSPRLAWLLLVVWCAWLYAAQGALASEPGIGPWAPDLGLLLLLALDGRMARDDARLAALLVALTRISFTADPPLAIFAGYLGAFWLSGRLREIVEVDRPLPRAILAGGLAALLSTFWIASRLVSLSSETAFALSPDMVWRGAVTTAVAALLFMPLLLRLPGLSPLWRRAT